MYSTSSSGYAVYITLIFLLLPKDTSATTFTVVNRCNYTVWPGIVSNAGSSGLGTTGFELTPHATQSFQAPPGWSGRFWGRTGCSFDPISRQGNCTTGDCGSNQTECNGGGAAPPATLAEFTIGSGAQDFYDVSLVDGYNLAMIVEPVGGSGRCGATGCAIDLNRECPKELRARDGQACMCACQVFRSPEFCCSGAYASPETCRPSVYSEMFKNACPRAYSYTFDDANSTFTCTAADYNITFCPSLTRLQELDTLSPPASVPVPVPVPASVPVPEPSSSSGKGDNGNTIRTVIIVASIVLSLVLAVSAIIWLRQRKTQKLIGIQHQIEDVDEIITAESLQYDFSTIKIATNDFSDGNKLGQGGFGTVYKATLPNGQEIAVKRLSRDSGQGVVEFKNEVQLLAKLQHRNLVRLLGFAIQGMENLLIYELVQNGSLDQFIFEQRSRSYLDWDRRYKIIGGIARGILYLHEDSRLKIIHRDLKASNILLDREMNPKIADFGMARSFGQDETQGNTSRIVGTYGYMPPEYIIHGKFSIKSDVFSFGVLVLEIISGCKRSNFRSGENVEDLLTFAWENWREGTAATVVDPELRSGSGSMGEMLRCIHIGLLCVQDNAAKRPTMASVVIMLNSPSISLALPSAPAFYLGSGYTTRLVEYDSINNLPIRVQSDRSSNNDVSITELLPR